MIGYARVSTIDQNLDRQIKALNDFGVKSIYQDKGSGKNFERVNYQKMYRKLKKGDVLVIKSIDRLGRNYDMIIDEWRKITKEKECDIVVLDMPLLDTRTTENNLIGKFISDIVLQILSFVSESERENIRARQAEGIRIAKEKGIHMGRPRMEIPDNFKEVARDYYNNKLTVIEASNLLGMKKNTFYRKANEQFGTKKKMSKIPKNAYRLAEDFYNYRITAKEAAAILGMKESAFYKYVRDTFGVRKRRIKPKPIKAIKPKPARITDPKPVKVIKRNVYILESLFVKKEYSTLMEIAEDLHVSASTITKHINGHKTIINEMGFIIIKKEMEAI